MLKTYLIICLLCLIISLLIGKFLIKFFKKISFGQNILEYVTEHKSKQGTPTMGGFIFLIPILVVSIIFFNKFSSLATIVLSVTMGYATIGFLDDYIKIKYAHNEGLKPYQKLIFQLAIALIIAVFCYKSSLVGSTILIPFSSVSINLGWWIIPLVVVVFLATTNSVNLTDGIDGLAGSVSVVFCLALFVLNFIILSKNTHLAGDYLSEMQNINIVLVASVASLIGYLFFNSNPARVFMGDTGSLALGGMFACICVFTKLELFLPLLGIMFVVSSFSSILQVVVYKAKHKRVFLMAPFHHHLQMKGLNETKICNIYILITFAVSLCVLLVQIYV